MPSRRGLKWIGCQTCSVNCSIISIATGIIRISIERIISHQAVIQARQQTLTAEQKEKAKSQINSFHNFSGVKARAPTPHVSIQASGVKQLFRYCFRVPAAKLNDAISSRVACLLKEERAKRGLSLNVLAQKAGLSRQTVSYVEPEVQNPTLDTLLRITSVLEVDLEKIIAKARKVAARRKD